MNNDKRHTDNQIDWQTLLDSALILALVGMVLWIIGGAQ